MNPCPWCHGEVKLVKSKQSDLWWVACFTCDYESDPLTDTPERAVEIYHQLYWIDKYGD